MVVQQRRIRSTLEVIYRTEEDVPNNPTPMEYNEVINTSPIPIPLRLNEDQSCFNEEVICRIKEAIRCREEAIRLSEEANHNDGGPGAHATTNDEPGNEERNHNDGAPGAPAPATTNNLRRSTRNPSQSVLSSPTFKSLEQKLKMNDPDVVVLKCKEYLTDSHSSPEIINAMLSALQSNTNCQGLYVQVRDQTNISFSITIMIITYKVSYNLF